MLMGDGSSGGVVAHPDEIRALGVALQQVVTADVGRAQDMVPDLKAIEYSNFTSTTLGLAIAYTVAVEFVEEQLHTLQTRADQIQQNLDTTAANWESSDQKSTIQSR
jgi:hypothetical protein